ncbi:MAG: nuclear transport factor 2 family protein [Alphaproteobacteria bacterium]|nr:nuclear transport factor 2 family protein [Alphaproteobacteria bacterium]
MLGTQAPAEEAEAIRGWFATLHGYVDAVDFTAARALFDESAISFGTFMDIVEGLDNIEQQQWRPIWPSIAGFRFNLDTLRVGVSNDRCVGIGVITWQSAGTDETGEVFPRPGRATVMFGRDKPGDPWKAIHTHFSLNPGTPPISHGSKPEAG